MNISTLKYNTERTEPLLSYQDPQPVEVLHADSTIPIVLVCEHAGFAVPQSLNRLGLSDVYLYDHMGGDIGAKDMAIQIADALGVRLVIQNYSRLVIDCNRPTTHVQSIPEISDTIDIIGNRNISQSHRNSRIKDIFTPYDTTLQHIFNTHSVVMGFSIHSFTKSMRNAPARPWDIGFLSRYDTQTAQSLLKYCQAQAPDLCMALNEPYQITDDTDWFVVRYAEKYNITHSLIEVCNAHLRTDEGIQTYAEILTHSIRQMATAMGVL